MAGVALAVASLGPAGGREGARARILDAAQEMFAAHGIRAVGIEELIAHSGVAKSTFYRHFRSKDRLVRPAWKAGGAPARPSSAPPAAGAGAARMACSQPSTPSRACSGRVRQGPSNR
jgi:hypothetical protein